MKKLRRFLFVALLLAGAATAVVMWLRSFGHPALAAYVAKLRGQGERLTHQELSANYSRTTNNTLAGMTNLLAKLGPPPAGLTNFHAVRFVDPDQPRATWNLNRPPWAAAADGTTNGSWEDLNGRLASAAPALRHLHQILEQPAPNGGRLTNYFEAHIPWRETRTAATWLACATLGSLHDGRRDDALASIRAMAGLADLHREEFPLAQQMTRVAAGGVGLDLTWEALQAEDWSDEQLAALQRCWEGHDFLAAVERGFEGERALPLEVLAAYRENRLSTNFSSNRTGSLRNPLVKWLHYSAVLGNDALYGLRHLQTEVELVRELRQGRPYGEVFEAFAKLDAVMDAKTRSPTRVFYLISLTGILDYKKAITAAAKTETKRRLAVTAITLRRYELRHGNPAQTLAALVPELLPEVPRDVIDGQPLRFHANSDGTWRLYSIGIDGKDNGGDGSVANAAGPSGLCEGRDAVWPLAATPEPRLP